MDMQGEEWDNVKPINHHIDSTAAVSISTRNTQPALTPAQVADDSSLHDASVLRDTNTRITSADHEGSSQLLKPGHLDALDFMVIDFPETSGKIRAEDTQEAADIGELQTTELQQNTSAVSFFDEKSLLQRGRDIDNTSGINDSGPDNAAYSTTILDSRQPQEGSGASPSSNFIVSTSASSNIEAEKADIEEKDNLEFGQMRSNNQQTLDGYSAKPYTNTCVAASPSPLPDDREEVPSNAESRDKATQGIWQSTGVDTPRVPPAEKVDGDWAAGVDDVWGGELGPARHVCPGVEPLPQAASSECMKEVDMGSASMSMGSQVKAGDQTMAVGDTIEREEGAEDTPYEKCESVSDGEAGRLEEKTRDAGEVEGALASTQSDPIELSRAGLGINTFETPGETEVAEAGVVEEHRAPECPEELVSERRDSPAMAGRRDGDETHSPNIEPEQDDARVPSIQQAQAPTVALTEEVSKDLDEVDNEGQPVPSASAADVDWSNFEDSNIIEMSGTGAVEAVESQQPRGEHLAGKADSEAQEDGWSSFESPPPSTVDRAPETPHPAEETPPSAHAEDPATIGDKGDLKLQYPGDSEGLTLGSPSKEDADASVAMSRSSSANPDASSNDDNGWGAFDEAPIAPASGVGVVDSGTTAPSNALGADFSCDSEAVETPEEEEAPPSSEPQGDGDGVRVGEDEQEWSDFGDFEEAPTVEKEEEAPPESDVAGPSDAGGQALSGKRGNAAGDTGSGVGTTWTAFARDGAESSSGDTPSLAVPTEPSMSGSQAVDSASLSSNERNLAIMVTVFERAFVVEEAVASRGSMAKGSGLEVTDRTPSLVSLTDLSHLLCHAQTSQRAPAMKLNSWTKSCILRGIQPVPDTLWLEKSTDKERTGKATGGNLRVHETDKPGIPAAQASRVVLPSAQTPTKVSLSGSSPATMATAISLDPKEIRPVEREKQQVICHQRQKEEKEKIVAPPAVSFETPAFASFSTEFPVPMPTEAVKRETVPDEPAPEAAPRTPPPPPSASSLIEKEGDPGSRSGAIEAKGEGDTDVGDGKAEAGPDEDIPRRDRDDDDLFDDFQSAPPAMATPSASPPVPQAEVKPVLQETSTEWNLDFFMAGPSKGGGTSVSVAASGRSLTTSADIGKPLDLVSQALAGFGIDNSPFRDRGPQEGGSMTVDGNVFDLSGGGPVASGIGAEGTAKGAGREVGSMLSELLRGAAKKGTTKEPLSEAALSRLATLPDMSFMLSDRLRFPMRAAALPTPRIVKSGGATFQ